MMRERGQHLRAPHELFQHLRWGLTEVGFHRDAAHARPLLLSAKDMVHKVAEFVEENSDVAILHQAGIVCRWFWKVADQRRFWHLFAPDAIEHRHHLGMAEFPRPRMHVEIEASHHFAVVYYIPGSTVGSHAGTFGSCWNVT